MEMNTRLQVEHPVTEAITGHDLVEWQLRVASGEPLPATQADIEIRGHAIEARICAENPDANFLPATGPIDVARWPDHVAFVRNADGERFHDPAPVRIDRGFDEGDAITPHYDSMIAKLIVWGADRAQALARLDAALAATRIVGLHTNVAFLRRVVNTKAFATADLDTALIERERAALFDVPPLPIDVLGAAAAAHVLAQERALEDHDPWSRRDGWRLFGTARRQLHLDIGGRREIVAVERHHDGALHLAAGGARHALAVRALGDGRHDVTLGDRRLDVAVYARGERLAIFTPHGSAAILLVDPIAHAGEGAAAGGSLTAPMPGKIVSVAVKAGDAVKAGQALAVMEAMKMEHTIAAPRDGVVAEVLYAAGDAVGEGAELLKLRVAKAA
jgi:3-methylcrotonyl-CoA carboxylase alpha subunit